MARVNLEQRRAEYAAKLRDPRWQRRRLTILERDEWTCQWCSDDSSTLHVHHFYYLPNTEPWEYDDDALITLCESCHADETEGRGAAEKLLLLELKKKHISRDDVRVLALAIRHGDFAGQIDSSEVVWTLRLLLEKRSMLGPMLDWMHAQLGDLFKRHGAGFIGKEERLFDED